MLKNKVALITGGSRGIGLGCALAMAKQGCAIAFCSLDDDESARQAVDTERTLNDMDIKAEWFACDVRHEDNVRLLVEETVSEFGRLDCMVNNVGWHPPAAKIDDISTEDFESLLTLNLTSTFWGCKYATPHLRTSKGSIVNIASKVGLVGQGSAVSYVTTKAGQVGMTKALALDLAADGVRVNAICPAGVDTPMMRQWAATLENPAEALAKEGANHPLGRMATIDEIGQVCAFLASDAARFITGQAICPDGGAGLGYQRWD